MPQPGYPPPGYQAYPPPGAGAPGYGGRAGYGGAPGYGMPPPPPPKKSNRTAWTIVLIVVGSLLVLCCLGGGIGGYFIYQAVKNTTNAATDATRAFIGDLESGDATDAYDHLCSSTKASFPEPVFASIVRSEPQITGYKIVNRSVGNTNGRQTASITVDLTRASGAVDRHRFPLKRESGNWLVCGQPY